MIHRTHDTQYRQYRQSMSSSVLPQATSPYRGGATSTGSVAATGRHTHTNTVYSVQYTVHSTLCTVQCTVHSVHCILCTVQCVISTGSVAVTGSHTHTYIIGGLLILCFLFLPLLLINLFLLLLSLLRLRHIVAVIRDLPSPQCQPNQTYCTAGKCLLT